MEPRVVAGWD